MANLLNLSIIGNEVLRCLINGPFRGCRATCIERSHYGHKLGDTVRVRVVRPLSGPAIDSAMVDHAAEVVLEHRPHSTVECPQSAQSLSVDSFSDRYAKPLALALASTVLGIWPKRATLVCGQLSIVDGYSCVELGSGIAIHVLQAYDAVKDIFILRADMLFGFLLPVARHSPLEAAAVALLLEARGIYVAQQGALRREA